jgi:hypothetical protein
MKATTTTIYILRIRKTTLWLMETLIAYGILPEIQTVVDE